MADFLKPWQRKLGVLSLLLSCVMMGGWMRSKAKRDRIGFDGLFAISEAGKITIIRHIPNIAAVAKLLVGF